MNRPIIADECVDFQIISALRDNGFTVISIAEEHPGWPDTNVLEFVFERQALLITEDKDFGELTYRLQKPSHGILLIRLIEEESTIKAKLVLALFQEDAERFWNTFSVLEKGKLRIRLLPGLP